MVLVIGAAVGGWFSRDDGTATPGLLAQGGYIAKDQQQSEPCDGLPAVDPADLRLLDPQVTVRSGVICPDSLRPQPDGDTSTAHEIPAAALPALIEALTAPDRHSNGSCTLQLILVPGFVLTLEDGTRIRPGLPGDGCHVRTDVAFDALAAGPAVRSTPPTGHPVPPEVTALLKQEAGLVVESPESATVPTRVPEAEARAIARTEYGSQIPADAVPDLYLVRVGGGPEDQDPGLTVGSHQWLVVYRDLDIATAGPAGADGQPSAGAAIRSAVIVVDAETGDIGLAHWTSSVI